MLFTPSCLSSPLPVAEMVSIREQSKTPITIYGVKHRSMGLTLMETWLIGEEKLLSRALSCGLKLKDPVPSWKVEKLRTDGVFSAERLWAKTSRVHSNPDCNSLWLEHLQWALANFELWGDPFIQVTCKEWQQLCAALCTLWASRMQASCGPETI